MDKEDDICNVNFKDSYIHLNITGNKLTAKQLGVLTKSNDAGKSEITNNGTSYSTYLETNRPSSSNAFLAIDCITLMQPFAKLLCTESMLFRIK